MKQIITQKLSYQDILNILIERHRIFSSFDIIAESSIELNSNSTVNDWRDSNDLLPWYNLYPILNDEYNMNASAEEWEKVLEPAKSKKLIDVCEFIANKANLPNIESVKLFGNDCLEAGIFRRFKKRIEQKSNIQISEIKPSSKISDYLDTYFEEIISETILLSKGKKVIERVEIKMKKKGFFNYVNIFEKDRFVYSITNIETFKDLILKIIEIGKFNIAT